MPRIRSIKPDFWNDEKLAQESESIMLTYIGIWNFSDDYGTVKANALWLKNQIFPYKHTLRLETFVNWLGRLEKLDALIPFTFNGESFYFIRNFRKHQRIDKPSDTRSVPEVELTAILLSKGYVLEKKECFKDSQSPPVVLPEPSRTDKEGEGKSKGGEEAPPPTPEEVSFLEFQRWLKDKAPAVSRMDEPFTMEQINALLQEYGENMIVSYIFKMQNWKNINKNRSANLTIRNWINRDVKQQANTVPNTPTNGHLKTPEQIKLERGF